MNGSDYIAQVRLSTKSNETLAEPGEACHRVPDASLPWLVNQGLIVLAPMPAPVAIAEPTEAEE